MQVGWSVIYTSQDAAWCGFVGQVKVRRRGPNWTRRRRERERRHLGPAVTRWTTRRLWCGPASHARALDRGTADEVEVEEVVAKKEYHEVTSRCWISDHETRSMHLDPATHSPQNDAENPDSRLATISVTCVPQMWYRRARPIIFLTLEAKRRRLLDCVWHGT